MFSKGVVPFCVFISNIRSSVLSISSSTHYILCEGVSHCGFDLHFPSVLAWRIPGPAEPGGLPSTGSHRVGYDRVGSDLAAAAAIANDDEHHISCYWLLVYILLRSVYLDL